MMLSTLYFTNRLNQILQYSLKQHSTGRHVTPLGHIILIPSPQVFALTPYVLIGETTNTMFIVFSLTLPQVEHMIYRIEQPVFEQFNILCTVFLYVYNAVLCYKMIICRRFMHKSKYQTLFFRSRRIAGSIASSSRTAIFLMIDELMFK